MRIRSCRRTAELRRDDAGKTLQSNCRSGEAFRIFSIWPGRRGGGVPSKRFLVPSRSVAGLHRGQLSPAQGNCAGSRFDGRDKEARSDHDILCWASPGRINHRAGSDKIERPTPFRHSMRSTCSQRCGISIRAQLFYRKQGAQHRDAQSRTETRLDAQRISSRARADRIGRTQEKIDSKNPKGPRRSGPVSLIGSRFYSAGIAGESRRIPSGGKTFSATLNRSREFTGDISLPGSNATFFATARSIFLTKFWPSSTLSWFRFTPFSI